MTNPAYEATNSDVEKLIADMKDSAEKATPGEWHLSNEHKLIIRDEDHLHIANAGYFDNPVEVADAKHIALANPKNVLALIAALEQAQKENKSQLAALTNTVKLWNEQRTRIAELESAPNGMMQLSNELAEMKRKCEGLNIRAVVMLRESVRNQWLKSESLADKIYWKNMHSIANEVVEAIRAGGTVEGE